MRLCGYRQPHHLTPRSGSSHAASKRRRPFLTFEDLTTLRVRPDDAACPQPGRHSAAAARRAHGADGCPERSDRRSPLPQTRQGSASLPAAVAELSPSHRSPAVSWSSLAWPADNVVRWQRSRRFSKQVDNNLQAAEPGRHGGTGQAYPTGQIGVGDAGIGMQLAKEVMAGLVQGDWCGGAIVAATTVPRACHPASASCRVINAAPDLE